MVKKKTSSEEGKVPRNRNSKKTEARKTPARNRSIKEVMKLWQDSDKEGAGG